MSRLYVREYLGSDFKHTFYGETNRYRRSKAAIRSWMDSDEVSQIVNVFPWRAVCCLYAFLKSTTYIGLLIERCSPEASPS